MLKTDTSQGQYEFEFSDKNFQTLKNMVTGHTGIELPDNKKTLMYTRLVRRLRALQLPSFDAYCARVSKDLKNNDTEELMHMVNAMTTNVTGFFREAHHFQDLRQHLPALYQHFGKLRIWCCASSTGEEPWSIASVVHDFISKNPNADIKIIATDIDKNVIDHASKGEYIVEAERVSRHPLLKKYLKPVEGALVQGGQPTFSFVKELRPLVTFKVMNLIEEWSLPDREYHIVFCRNVIIYFSKETQRHIFDRMQHMMPLGSRLYIGHSESLLNVSTAYDNVGRTTYVKGGLQ